MYYKNLNSLKKKSVTYYELLRNLRVDEFSLFGAKKTKNEFNVFIKKFDSELYLTSVNFKKNEAKLLVDEILKEEHDEIVIFGIGNEVILTELTSRISKNQKIHIFDFKEVFKLLMDNVSLSKVMFDKVSSIALIDKNVDVRGILEKVFANSNMNTKVFILPQYERHLKSIVEIFIKSFKQTLLSKKSGLAVNLNYQKLWIYNSIINFKHVISTPKFVSLNKYDFSRSLALIVGAGPSLSYEYEALKKLSEKNNVYIFAIGSAYKALAKQGVNIDMLFSYDPTSLNKDVFDDYYKKKYDFPVCFGSSIGFESIRSIDYNRAYHILTSQDYFSNYLLEEQNKEIVVDAPSIAVIALQALVKIGFKNIGFVGQNLSYVDEKNYAVGIEYERTKNRKFQSNLKVKNVFGEDVFTNHGYLRTLEIIENVIQQLPNVSFFNTTYGGARINGAPYTPMDSIDFSVFSKSSEFNVGVEENNYNLIKAKERFDSLREERVLFRKKLVEGYQILIEIETLLAENRTSDMSLITEMENLYNDIRKMTYYKVLISKLDRSYINIFESGVIEIKRETDMVKKYELVYKRLGTLLTLFKKDDEKVNELFEYISKWIVWE